MTREQALAMLEEQQANGDTEYAHIIADNVLTELLHDLGYDDVVEAWKKVDKWYA